MAVFNKGASLHLTGPDRVNGQVTRLPHVCGVSNHLHNTHPLSRDPWEGGMMAELLDDIHLHEWAVHLLSPAEINVRRDGPLSTTPPRRACCFPLLALWHRNDISLELGGPLQRCMVPGEADRRGLSQAETETGLACFHERREKMSLPINVLPVGSLCVFWPSGLLGGLGRGRRWGCGAGAEGANEHKEKALEFLFKFLRI